MQNVFSIGSKDETLSKRPKNLNFASRPAHINLNGLTAELPCGDQTTDDLTNSPIELRSVSVSTENASMETQFNRDFAGKVWIVPEHQKQENTSSRCFSECYTRMVIPNHDNWMLTTHFSWGKEKKQKNINRALKDAVIGQTLQTRLLQTKAQLGGHVNSPFDR